MERRKMYNLKEWFKSNLENIAAFCLGFALSGIFGLLDGVMLSIALIIAYVRR
jgi:hypothetical protein